jgi:hypothetical protein
VEVASDDERSVHTESADESANCSHVCVDWSHCVCVSDSNHVKSMSCLHSFI